MMSIKQEKPLVYSCGGCSNLAQLAHDLALWLEREGVAERSCISGVAGGIEPLVQQAKSGRALIALEGCSLSCVQETLKQHQVTPQHHIKLTDVALKFREEGYCTLNDTFRALEYVYHKLGLDAADLGSAVNPLSVNSNKHSG